MYNFSFIFEIVFIQDSLYFEPVLDALQEDIIEQEQFINTTIRLGRPALANLEKQQHEFNVRQ